MAQKTYSVKDQQKELVAEQPGFGITLVGIFFIVLIGFSMRSLIAPERIRDLVARQLQDLPPGVAASFESAAISLSDGIFPEIALVISNIALSSDSKCQLSPHLEIDELRFPVAWGRLLQGDVYIHSARANEVSLSLRSEFKPCEAPAKAVAVDQSEPYKSAQVSTAALSLLPVNIDVFEINTLRIHYLPIAFTYFEVRDLTLRSQLSPRTLTLDGTLALGGETLTGDYFSQANLDIRYAEGENASVRTHIAGNWREGTYVVDGEYSLTQKNYKLQMDYKHIPVSQILPVLKKYKWLQMDYAAKQLWFSAIVKTEGSAMDVSKNPVNIEKIKVEGDLGELETHALKIKSLSPVRFEPMTVSIHSMDIEQLLNFLGKSHPSSAFGKLGVFHGTALVKDSEDIEIEGTHSGFEFIFSNRGFTQLQPISLLAGTAEFKRGNWKVQIDQVKPSEGAFLGNIKLSADRDWKNVSMNLKVDDFSLGPAVQKLMTGGGDLGSLTGDLRLQIKSNKITELSGFANFSDLFVDNIRVRKPKFNFSSRSGEVWVDFLAPSIMLENNSLAFRTMGPVIATRWPDKQHLELLRVSSQLVTRDFKEFHWQGFQATVDKALMQSKGGWDSNSALNGNLTIRRGDGLDHWTLAGTRDRPQFEKGK